MTADPIAALVIANDFPFPPNHGGRVDIWRRIRVLHELGLSLDLVATVKEPPLHDQIEAVRPYCKRIWLVPRSLRAGLWSLRPVQVASRKSLATLQLDRAYDFVLIESDQSAAILDNPQLRAGLRVLRVHNDEREFCLEAAASERSWIKRLYYWQEAVRFGHFSSRLRDRRVDLIWFSSKRDYDRHMARKRASRSQAIFLPPPLDLEHLRTRALAGRQVLFLGTLSLPTNVEGLQWYLREVHPALCDLPGYRLVIAGNTRGSDVSWLYRAAADRVAIFQDVTDPESLYDSSAVFISPMLRGASIKVKTLHAIENGLPVVSTTTGNEGTGLENARHLMIADTAGEFAARLRQLLCDPGLPQALVDSAQAYLRQNYQHAVIIEQSLRIAGMDLCPYRPAPFASPVSIASAAG